MLVCCSDGPPSSKKTVCKLLVRVGTLIILGVVTFEVDVSVVIVLTVVTAATVVAVGIVVTVVTPFLKKAIIHLPLAHLPWSKIAHLPGK